MKINCPKCGEEIKLKNNSSEAQKKKYGPDYFKEIAKKSVAARRAKYGENLGLDRAWKNRWSK